jgi:serine-type D-Ala-D-Ala carboxypeptidase
LIDDEIGRLLKHHVVQSGAAPGASAAVGTFAGGAWRFAVGHAGVQSPLCPNAVEARTLYDLASLTKPVFACALARLVRSGTLRWDTPLGDVLPLARESVSRDVPLIWLLSHRAGLAAHLPLYELPEASRGTGDADRRALLLRVAGARRDECAGEPGRDGHEPLYSDLGYILLGVVMELVTGVPLDALIAREVLQPLGLGLGSARQFADRLGRPGFLRRVAPTETLVARGGQIHGDVHDDNAWLLARTGCSGHAGLFGEALDVARFGAAVLDGARGRQGGWLGDSELDTLLHERPGGSLRAGFDGKASVGSSAGGRFGRRAFGHLGFTGTSVWCEPDAQVVVALLTNRVCPSRQNLKLRVLRPALHGALFDLGLRLRQSPSRNELGESDFGRALPRARLGTYRTIGQKIRLRLDRPE